MTADTCECPLYAARVMAVAPNFDGESRPKVLTFNIVQRILARDNDSS